MVLGTLALRLGVAALTMVVFVFSYRFVLWRLPDDCRIHSLCVVLCSLNILFAFALILCTLTYRLPQQPHSNGLPIVLVPYETINVARVATCCSSNHSAYSDRTGSDTSGEPGTNCGAGSCLNWISSLQLLDLVKLLLLQPRVAFSMRWLGYISSDCGIRQPCLASVHIIVPLWPLWLYIKRALLGVEWLL